MKKIVKKVVKKPAKAPTANGPVKKEGASEKSSVSYFSGSVAYQIQDSCRVILCLFLQLTWMMYLNLKMYNIGFTKIMIYNIN